MAVATKKVSKILEKSTKEYMEQVDVHTAYMKDIFEGIRLVKSFHLMDIVSKQYQQKNTLVEEKKTINECIRNYCKSKVGRSIHSTIPADIRSGAKAGKKYAIVGTSGKSTLFMLIQGLYDSYKGGIAFDGMELKNIRRESVCDTIGCVSQEVFIFDDTLRNNITLYGDYSEEQIKNAIDAGGQRTRVNVARALLKNYPSLMLDEFTSALDMELAYEIEKNILENSNATIISISHKLTKNILKMYDEIFVLKDGKIVEKGSFDELMELKQNLYSLYMLS